jgi:hypothetical protein
MKCTLTFLQIGLAKPPRVLTKSFKSPFEPFCHWILEEIIPPPFPNSGIILEFLQIFAEFQEKRFSLL